jgi:hypothetical protein
MFQWATETGDMLSSHCKKWYVVLSKVIYCPPIETCDMQQITFHNGRTAYHFLQWDDNISPVSIGWQQIACYNRRTSDIFFNVMTPFHVFQWDDNRSLFEKSDLLSSHWNTWNGVITLKKISDVLRL